MSDELKPCPFCGGEAEFERTGTPQRSCIVVCRDCGGRLESGDEFMESGQSWNSRADDPLRTQLAAMTAERDAVMAKVAVLREALVDIMGFPDEHIIASHWSEIRARNALGATK